VARQFDAVATNVFASAVALVALHIVSSLFTSFQGHPPWPNPLRGTSAITVPQPPGGAFMLVAVDPPRGPVMVAARPATPIGGVPVKEIPLPMTTLR
jgi:hypothetical protein